LQRVLGGIEVLAPPDEVREDPRKLLVEGGSAMQVLLSSNR
jgi:hypothetical protein